MSPNAASWITRHGGFRRWRYCEEIVPPISAQWEKELGGTLRPEPCLLPDGRAIVVGGKNDLRVFDTDGRKVAASRIQHAGRTANVLFSPSWVEARLLLPLESGLICLDEEVEVLWDIMNGQMEFLTDKDVSKLKRDVDYGKGLLGTAGKERIAFSSGKGCVRIVDIARGKVVGARNAWYRSLRGVGEFAIGAVRSVDDTSFPPRILSLCTLETVEADLGEDLSGFGCLEVDGVAFFASSRSLVAVSLRDGRASWRVIHADEQLDRATRLASDGKVLFSQMGDAIAAYDVGSGERLWQTKEEPELYGRREILVTPSHVMALTKARALQFLDKRTGEEAHSQPLALDGELPESFNGANGRVYFTDEKTLRCYVDRDS